jgi:hypothetical protein
MNGISNGWNTNTALPLQSAVTPTHDSAGEASASKRPPSDSVKISNAARQLLGAKTSSEKESVMMNVQTSQYTYDQRATVGNTKSSVFGANAKGDRFDSLLSEKSNGACSQHSNIIVELTADDMKNKQFIGLLPEGQNGSASVPNTLKLWGDSRDSALPPGVFYRENDMYTPGMPKLGANKVTGLAMPEFMKYRINMPPSWYADMVNDPMNALNHQQADDQASSGLTPAEDQLASGKMDEEQVRTLIAEYHQALGESLGLALNRLGVKGNNWNGSDHFLYSPEGSAKLREEMSKIMNGNQRIKEVMSLLGVEV